MSTRAVQEQLTLPTSSHSPCARLATAVHAAAAAVRRVESKGVGDPAAVGQVEPVASGVWRSTTGDRTAIDADLLELAPGARRPRGANHGPTGDSVRGAPRVPCSAGEGLRDLERRALTRLHR